MDERPKLRLTIVVPSSTRGGAELWQERLLDHTDAFHVDVVALSDGDAAGAWRRRGIPVAVIDTQQSPRDMVAAALRLSRHLRRNHTDIVLGHGVKAGLVASTAGRLAGVHSCWVRHDDSFPGRLTNLADRLSDGQISTAAHLWDGRGATQTLTLMPPNGAGPVTRADALVRVGRAEHPATPCLAMATRLAPYKGVDDAIVALSDVRASKWSLDVYGIEDHAYPNERARLQELATHLDLGDRVRFCAPRDDIGSLMSAYDAVAVLTRVGPDERLSKESFSMVASEAMAAGTPVIAVSPVSDRVGPAGIHVPPSDPQSVADALHTLSDVQRRREHGDAGRTAASAALTPQQSADQFASFLHDLSHRPGAHLEHPTHPMSVVTTVLDEAAGTERLIGLLVPQLGQGRAHRRGRRLDRRHRRRRGGSRRHRPRIRLVTAEGAGISRGRNIGIREARHATIACTDVGCDPAPNWLSGLRSAVVAHPDAGLWTGTYRAAVHDSTQLALAAVGYPDPGELDHPTMLSRAYTTVFGLRFDPTMPTGRSMAFSREAWSAAGGFPEDLQTGEDVLFGQAICRTHRSIMVRDAEVTWEQRPTLRSTAKMYFRYGRGSGLSGNHRLLMRDSVRVAGYVVGGLLLTRGHVIPRGLALSGAGMYWSLPLARIKHSESARPERMAAAAKVPALAALCDLSKVAGAVDGLARRRGRA